MKTCLLGMDKPARKAVNYENIKEITQGPDENPSLFYCQVTEVVIKYTHLTPEIHEGYIYIPLILSPSLLQT
jgi:hypothetical protein